ncbi:MAG: hypothetical protein JNL82_17380 [Myxococcales bacterium]|nr:hypothetical protein [Myxococcales bacterium]
MSAEQSNPSLEESLLEIVKISLQRERELDRVAGQRNMAEGRTGLQAAISSANEAWDDHERMEANLGHQEGDPRYKLMMDLSYDDVRRLEVLVYAAARGWSLEEASASVPKQSQHRTVDHLLTSKPLEVDLITGWAKALDAGVRDLRSWDPDAARSSEDAAYDEPDDGDDNDDNDD